MDDFDFPDGEPSAEDLAAIEAEEPMITAEIEVLDAEIGMLEAAERGGPSAVDWQRLRRANRRLINVALPKLINTAVRRHGAHVCDPWRLQERRLSGCRYGCKVMRCPQCGAEQVEHRAAYGCPAGLAVAR